MVVKVGVPSSSAQRQAGGNENDNVRQATTKHPSRVPPCTTLTFYKLWSVCVTHRSGGARLGSHAVFAAYVSHVRQRGRCIALDDMRGDHLGSVVPHLQHVGWGGFCVSV